MIRLNKEKTMGGGTIFTTFDDKRNMIQDNTVMYVGDEQKPGKAIASKDARKKKLVSALKHGSQSNRVTNLRQHKDGTVTGECLKYNPKTGSYDRNGIWSVEITERAPPKMD